MSCNNCNCNTNPCNCGCKSTTTTTCMPVSPEPCYDLCDEVIVSDCVIYDGPNLDCYGIKNGDSVKSIFKIIFDKLNVTNCSCSFTSVIANWVPAIPPTTTTSTSTSTTTSTSTSTSTSSSTSTTSSTTTVPPTTSTSSTSTSTSTSSTSTSTSTSSTSSSTTSTTTQRSLPSICLSYTHSSFGPASFTLDSPLDIVDNTGTPFIKPYYNNVSLTPLALKWNVLFDTYELVNTVTNQAIAYTNNPTGISNTWIVYPAFISTYSNITTTLGVCGSGGTTSSSTTTSTTTQVPIQAIIQISFNAGDPWFYALGEVVPGSGQTMSDLTVAVTIDQYGTTDCTGSTVAPQFNPPGSFIMTAGDPYGWIENVGSFPDPSANSLKLSSITINGINITSNPQIINIGGYNYEIQGLNSCLS